MSQNIGVIFAAGVGSRFDASFNGIPKQFIEVCGKPVIVHTLEYFENHDDVHKIYVAVPLGYCEYMEKLKYQYELSKLSKIIVGGANCQDSIYKILKIVESENSDDSIVLIHDGVRPILTKEIISKNINTAKKWGNAITCSKSIETVLVCDNSGNLKEIPIRENTYIAQAPQTFILKDIINAHEKVREYNINYKNIVDSCSLLKFLGNAIYMVEGHEKNIKITYSHDLKIFRALLKSKDSIVRVGDS